MRFVDISTEKQTVYRLEKDEKAVFFMHNRSEHITFELAGPGAEARIFVVMTGTSSNEQSLRIEEHHLAPDTVSSATIRNVLDDDASLSYEGTIRIERGAVRSDAMQDIRSLLLSSGASVSAEPALEILEDDVRCRHSATASPVNEEQLFFIRSRGLSEQRAKQLLVEGFLNEVIEKMGGLQIPFHELEKIDFQNQKTQLSKHKNQTKHNFQNTGSKHNKQVFAL